MPPVHYVRSAELTPDRISTCAAYCTPNDLGGDGRDDDVNTLHLQLFHFFLTETCSVFSRDEKKVDLMRSGIVRCSFEYIYLMHEVLAFAAFHMSVRSPERASRYTHVATSLQSRALAGLEDALKTINADSCLALLFFSHTIGVHSFCDIFQVPKASLGSFLCQLIQTVHLLRGVNAVIRSWWDVLIATEMGEFMRAGEAYRLSNENVETEVPQLHTLIATADMSESTRDVYKQALTTLDVAICASDHSGDSRTDINNAFAWLVTLSQDFTNLLAERRPEALIFLAYFAVVLHRRRHSWIVGSAGRQLFIYMSEFLGDSWSELLAWPSERILQSTEIGSGGSES